MKHTSIRLSEKHLELIKGTGKSATNVIVQALDAYFGVENPQVEQVRALIHEHEKVWHAGAHEIGIPTNGLGFGVAEQQLAQYTTDMLKDAKEHDEHTSRAKQPSPLEQWEHIVPSEAKDNDQSAFRNKKVRVKRGTIARFAKEDELVNKQAAAS